MVVPENKACSLTAIANALQKVDGLIFKARNTCTIIGRLSYGPFLQNLLQRISTFNMHR